jgi:glycosyltransferase involved in cell wall biosynthesis
MSELRPLKVLVCAFAFSPIRGTEYATGWDYVRAISSRHRVWVIARSLTREETEQYLLQHADALPNVTIHYIPLTDRTFHIPFREILYSLRYRYWQWRAYRLARVLDAEINFDIIHLVNLTSFREPGYLWKLGKPFVWGPVGGLQFFPMRLLNAVPLFSRPFFALKNLSTLWDMHISRGPRRAAAAARSILAPTSTAAKQILRLWRRDATLLCEVSAPDLDSKLPVRRGPKEPLRIIWCGSCEPRKALNIVLLALDQIKQSPVDWRLVALGDGPLLGNWKALACRLGLAERCSFLGRLSRADALSVMATGHCLVHSSLYDGTPTVVAEALAHGMPVICLDHFGNKDVVNTECGIKISPNTLDQVIRDFAKAIEAIGLDEDRRFEMAMAAQKASVHLTWKSKEGVINNLYDRILETVKLPNR